MARDPSSIKGMGRSTFEGTTPRSFRLAQGNPAAISQLNTIGERTDFVKLRARSHFSKYEETWVVKEAMTIWKQRSGLSTAVASLPPLARPPLRSFASTMRSTRPASGLFRSTALRVFARPQSRRRLLVFAADPREMMMTTIYDDGGYVITDEAFSTPSRIYPLAHATVRLRRDPLWLALSACGVATASLMIYGDLLTMQEYAVIAIAPLTLVVIALNLGVLAIDAVGHKGTVVFTTAARARKIFAAMRRAKLAENSHFQTSYRAAEESGK